MGESSADYNSNVDLKKLFEMKRKLTHLVKDYQSAHIVLNSPGVSESTRNSQKGEYINAEYKSVTDEFMLRFEVQGTGYEGRSEHIEKLNIGDTLCIVREPDNTYDQNTLNVLNEDGKSLGNVPKEISKVISPLLDAEMAKVENAKVIYVEPLSKRSKRAKKAILYAEINGRLKNIPFDNFNGSTICILGGAQIGGWYQRLQILKCEIPVKDSLLIFELYNRWNGEYEIEDRNNADLLYLGLDNLEIEVIAAREKMMLERREEYDYSKNSKSDSFYKYLSIMIESEPERYGDLKNYINAIDLIDSEFDNEVMKQIFESRIVDEKNYYWIDQTQVTSSEWAEECGYGFNHWYEIMELYSPGMELPFDLSDEDIVSIFGFGKFEAFADLSYGC